MKIKEIISQMRRDFRTIFICEHCENEEELSGYDDTYFHQKVIPAMKCKKCNKSSPQDYRAYAPKYDDGVQI
jgi:transcription elongation factor Elf1